MTSQTRFGWLLAAVFALALVAVWRFATAQDEKRAGVQKWEYHAIHGGYVESRMKQAGEEGWELVAVTAEPNSAQTSFYFKRPK